jgi:hypothetical protein
MNADEISRLNADELWDLADDSERSIGCDWRAEPDEVVGSMNKFLPPELQLRGQSSEAGFSLSLGKDQVFFPMEQLNAAAEPSPVIRLVAAANLLLAPGLELRSFKCMEQTDAFSFLCADRAFWRALDASEAAERIFRRVLMDRPRKPWWRLFGN